MWAPWVATRLKEILPLLQAAVQRGVEVVLFIRTDRDELMQQPSAQTWLQQVQQAVPRMVRYHKMHQKILVVDEQVTLLGSLNVLSHRDTREVMVVHEGRRFARKLLEHEHARAAWAEDLRALRRLTFEQDRTWPDA
jgi:phosphatidylserine/phosphatidylglycerophosphate/cardiolipin synthase-like enzyme